MAKLPFRRVVIGGLILAVGVIGLVVLVALRPDPPKQEREELAPLVRVAEAEQKSGIVTVSGSGTVSSVREVQLAAQVQGRVAEVNPAFVSGGAFRKGEVLVRLDTTDYALAVRAAEAEVTQARFNLIVAREESEIAREEWASLQERDTTLAETGESEMGSLVFREPEIKLAESALQAARARLADAKLRLARTAVRAPFNGRIRARQAEIGQFLGPGAPVATLYDTDQVEIAVPLSAEKAELIDGLFAERGLGNASIGARVRRSVNSRTHTWPGAVHRVEGALDPTTRTVRIVVRVDDPYRIEGDRPPLFVGSFASVEIDARELDSYVVIPADALHEDPREDLRENRTSAAADPDLDISRNIVWVVDSGRIRLQPVRVLKESDNRAIVTRGLTGGDRVVISDLGVVTDSMAVRIEDNS